MTNKQAIEVLNMIETHGSLPTKAKERAIKALENERPKARWIKDGSHYYYQGIPHSYYKCSGCSERWKQRFKYCPECGAEMEE